MFNVFSVALLFSSSIALAVADPLKVVLDQATVTGVLNGTVIKFLGIPYAEAPIGNLRFNLPLPVQPYISNFTAVKHGPSCIGQTQDTDNLFPGDIQYTDYSGFQVEADNTQDEDCLSLNVVKPTNITSPLPVVVWIYGGGFQTGATVSYDASSVQLVTESMEIGKPIIYVSMNHRGSAYGYLASAEVKAANAGNAGLQDQRAALRWVKKYIGAFGGDPEKVTIWGESSGAISAALQMVAKDGDTEGLFRGAFLQSGAPIPVGDITQGQVYYNQLVKDTGCTGTGDTLACLRSVSISVLKTAVNKSPGAFSYQSLVLAWVPRADGVFLTDNPQKLVQEGKVAKIPFVSGNCDDEGTVFSNSTRNITTEGEFQQYIKTFWAPRASDSELADLWTEYSSDVTLGSPFNTSIFNAITPQFKRLAAFQGDIVFQAPRRFFMQALSGKQKQWGYLTKRVKFFPGVGSFHGSDLFLNLMNTYVIYFTNYLDPNVGIGPTWPEYTTANPEIYEFPTYDAMPVIALDNYRQSAMDYLMKLSLAHPI